MTFRGEGSLNAFESGTGGYGYNHQYIGGRNDLYGSSPASAARSARHSDVTMPAATVMFTDAAISQQQPGIGVYVTEYSFCEPPFWHAAAGPMWSVVRPTPSIHFRHHATSRTTAAFADGHAAAQSLNKSKASVYGVSMADNLKLGFGWFTPDGNDLFDLR